MSFERVVGRQELWRVLSAQVQTSTRMCSLHVPVAFQASHVLLCGCLSNDGCSQCASVRPALAAVSATPMCEHCSRSASSACHLCPAQLSFLESASLDLSGPLWAGPVATVYLEGLMSYGG